MSDCPAEPLWAHATASGFDPQSSVPSEMDWEESQRWCNFVLMRPRVLPEGLVQRGATMRPEAPPGRAAGVGEAWRATWTLSNRACHRAEYAGGGRRLRIKQFFYDWAPPAFDHPHLWRSRTRPFPVGDHLGWLGNDFRGRVSAATCLDRTTIEVSTLEGSFSDEELQALCRGLEPAVPALRQRIVQTSFADLCYQARHPEPPVEVPVGYWSHHRESLPAETRVFHAAEAPGDLPGRNLCAGRPGGYVLDSVLVYGALERPVEVDYCFGHENDLGRTLRLLATPAGLKASIAYPPVRDEQPCSDAVRTVHGRPVYHAFLDEDIGPHEAVWEADDLVFMLLVKPTAWTDLNWFLELLTEFIPQ